MADIENDDLELTERPEADEVEEQEEQDQDETEIESEGEEAPDDDDEVLTFDDEAAPASGDAETGLVKHLRAQLRETSKEVERLRRQSPVPQPQEVGEKPTLAGCDYDEQAFEQQLDAWKARKAAAEVQAQEAEQVQKKAAEQWNRDLQSYQAKRSALKFKDADEAESTALASLSEAQQAIIVRNAADPAMFVYALGKFPAKLAELSQITELDKLAAAVARLEGKFTVKKRGSPPEPERIARGGAPTLAGKDKNLERLEKEADRTGDRTKLIAYRQKLKAQAK